MGCLNGLNYSILLLISPLVLYSFERGSLCSTGADGGLWLKIQKAL